MGQLEMAIKNQQKKSIRNKTSRRLIRINYLLAEDDREVELYSIVRKGMLQSIQVEADQDEIVLLEECKYDEDCYNIGFYCIKEFMNPEGKFEVTGIPTEYYCYDEECGCCTGNLIVKFFSRPMSYEELLEWERNRQIKLKQDKEKIIAKLFITEDWMEQRNGKLGKRIWK